MSSTTRNPNSIEQRLEEDPNDDRQLAKVESVGLGRESIGGNVSCSLIFLSCEDLTCFIPFQDSRRDWTSSRSSETDFAIESNHGIASNDRASLKPDVSVGRREQFAVHTGRDRQLGEPRKFIH